MRSINQDKARDKVRSRLGINDPMLNDLSLMISQMTRSFNKNIDNMTNLVVDIARQNGCEPSSEAIEELEGISKKYKDKNIAFVSAIVADATPANILIAMGMQQDIARLAEKAFNKGLAKYAELMQGVLARK